MAEALTQRFEEAGSWAAAKSTMDLLEECPVITEECLERIKAAEKSNHQVKNAWDVPERINSLAQKHQQIGEAKYSSSGNS